MKTRRSKPEPRGDARRDLEAIQEALRKPLLQGEPFDYSARAQQVQESQHWNSLASGLRFRPPPNAHIWDVHEATAARFWEAIEAAYPPGFWDDYQRIKGGGPKGLESAIGFLEADPYFFRSGYVKEKLIRHIQRPMLKPQHVARLHAVVLAIVDKRDGREFRAYCRLARKVDAPALREQLRHRLTRALPSGEDLTPDEPSLLQAITRDKGIRRRARWVLEALEQN